MAEDRKFTRDDLLTLRQEHDCFVGVDSDGCVFDTMEIKQKQCFHPTIIRHWRLEAIEPQLREAAEFVNLYSIHRGQNRFPNLVLSIDLLRDRPEVQAADVVLPAFTRTREWIASGAALGDPALVAEVERTGDPELADLLAWSRSVNERVQAVATDVPIFDGCRECLALIDGAADMIVVSQTPTDAIVREWDHSGILHYPQIIAGQELGSKAEHLELATRGHYAAKRVLMIGDAPGDRSAAEANGALFYPIKPGQEAASWRQLQDEAFAKFLNGSYAGPYQAALNAAFDALLPATPPWA